MKNLILLLGIILMACSTVSTKGVQQSKDFTLSKYKTFGFYQVESSGDALGSNYASNLDLLKNAITKQLVSKGVSVASDNPDLMVNIGIVVSKQVQTRETSFSNPGDRVAYMGQRNYHWESKEVVVGTYKEGAVTVDLVDRTSGQLVWQGTAEGVVPEKEKNVPALIEEAMEKLFSKLK